ncbi:MAG: tetratricopeptide repeat protein [Rhodobacteraceae bacterium]|nr:tetratricopeptide repeat protein [Paracoccaceae bacterium]
MKAGFLTRAAFVGAFSVFLISCEEGSGSLAGSGFRDQYIVARSALEEGRYDTAMRRYERMIPTAGQAAPRLKLEYAHAQLRAGDYAGARQTATALAQGRSDGGRQAALAVAGAAAHELALQAKAQGDRATAKALFAEARSAMEEVVKTAPKMDPHGALAGRVATIKVQEKTL